MERKISRLFCTHAEAQARKPSALLLSVGKTSHYGPQTEAVHLAQSRAYLGSYTAVLEPRIAP